jgi:UDP-N-acetylmuramate dehydrogenase
MQTPPFEFFKEHYPLAPETYYKVGGPARMALLPRNAAEAEAAYVWMRDQPGPKLILGFGSNVLISDEGFPGIVLFTHGLTNVERLGDDRYAVDAGVSLDDLVVEVLLPNNYEGTGSLTGIPGSVGGAIFMNAGTVNGSTCELLHSVDMATPDGVVTVYPNAAIYSYRAQTFCRPEDLILKGVFRFRRAAEDQRSVYEHYLQRRREKQPQGFCCGSVFKNPENDHAGRLIEACGLKGTRRGGAVISPQHANFIMNENNATFDDILGLIELCKQRVHERFGIGLEEEVRIIR